MGTITRNAANNFTTGGVILPAAINDTSVASLTELENVAAGGAMNLISEQTASASSSIDFTSGIDSTYPIYRFEFINMHPSTNAQFEFQSNASGGTGYNETMTTTIFEASHHENDSESALRYKTDNDQAQGTSYQNLSVATGTDNDNSCSGTLEIFNPSSTTFVKHFIATIQNYRDSNRSQINYVAGYFNTTNAIDEFSFRFSSGNIDSGTIKLYGISGS
jgi:hypothetical protein